MTSTQLLLLYLGASSAVAQERQGWQYESALYGWFSAVDGSLNIPAGNYSVSANASDIIGNLQGIFESDFVARNDRWSILADFIYVYLQSSENRRLNGLRMPLHDQRQSECSGNISLLVIKIALDLVCRCLDERLPSLMELG